MRVFMDCVFSFCCEKCVSIDDRSHVTILLEHHPRGAHNVPVQKDECMQVYTCHIKEKDFRQQAFFALTVERVAWMIGSRVDMMMGV